LFSIFFSIFLSHYDRVTAFNVAVRREIWGFRPFLLGGTFRKSA